MAYLDGEAFWADKGKEAGPYNGFKKSDDKECEDVEDDQAEKAQAKSRGGARNKYTFSKVSQIVFSQGFASAKCMYFGKLSQLCFHRNT